MISDKATTLFGDSSVRLSPIPKFIVQDNFASASNNNSQPASDFDTAVTLRKYTKFEIIKKEKRVSNAKC